ncbi:dihydroorotase [Ureibacillus massiliensis 4400831 = CIP 108448 = CCUG 49529]|uniref:Dihydroorotase n=1 Tax=Ureibacillus massiliensis 4400831 = CIP 108448 = CCUG 49529 TaxID=1211035 RepID=A0A0A3JYQ8_9BACL|nr:dihydroorotase [Ureibacillus massiliensis]KGR92142.1 dihydroorotase [Ureibacillus massiliensis 4400831 = CIP 108448 = CCUG 49529]
MTKYIQNVQMLNELGELVTTSITIEGKVIAEIGGEKPVGAEVIDGKGSFVSPGFVDLHVHLREPGYEHKETIKTGTQSAAKGGFTTICAMPNTKPVPDSKENFELIKGLIKESAVVRVLPYGSLTVDEAGDKRTNIAELREHGAVAFSDDGVGIQLASTMYEQMQDAAKIDAVVVAHCEDNSLIYDGVMHEGKRNKELGLPGIPSICESVQIARDVLLAEAAGARYHVCHVSTKESVRAVRDAKAAGIRVTAEVCPHHLLLEEMDIPSDDANWKMNPPLRAKDDQDSLHQALLDGTIDCIATDHAPHTTEEKCCGMVGAPFGIVGFETAFPLLYTHFVETGKWTLKQLVEWMTVKPAAIFDLPYGKIKVGASADLTIIDLNKEQKVEAEFFATKGRNTPFNGWAAKGWPIMTIFEGSIVYKEAE